MSPNKTETADLWRTFIQAVTPHLSTLILELAVRGVFVVTAADSEKGFFSVREVRVDEEQK